MTDFLYSIVGAVGSKYPGKLHFRCDKSYRTIWDSLRAAELYIESNFIDKRKVWVEIDVRCLAPPHIDEKYTCLTFAWDNSSEQWEPQRPSKY